MRAATHRQVIEAPSGALRRSGDKPTLWFVVPAHGREQLSAICLRQLRRTCDSLTAAGIEASAVVIADDANLDTAAELGFATVERDNEFLSAKFNDGIQLAADPRYNPRPADYVVPCGSDDWVDHRLFLNLPSPGEIRCFRWAAFAREDGSNVQSRLIKYDGGVGVRVYRRDMLKHLGYRPAAEDLRRGCDTSILVNVRRELMRGKLPEPRIVYGDLHPFQIVDWKSPSEQLNTADQVAAIHRLVEEGAPRRVLDGVFPRAAIVEMHAHHNRQLVAA